MRRIGGLADPPMDRSSRLSRLPLPEQLEYSFTETPSGRVSVSKAGRWDEVLESSDAG